MPGQAEALKSLYAALAWCAIVENNEKTTGSPRARVHLAAMTHPSFLSGVRMVLFAGTLLLRPATEAMCGNHNGTTPLRIAPRARARTGVKIPPE